LGIIQTEFEISSRKCHEKSLKTVHEMNDLPKCLHNRQNNKIDCTNHHNYTLDRVHSPI